MSSLAVYIFLFFMGLVVGSFLNVCVYRMPRKESIMFPRSHCTTCRKVIPWHDNIPLISYILLRGRCRWCRSRISSGYFFVELLTGILFTALFGYFGLSPKYLIFLVFGCALIVATFIDIGHKIIPDEISFYGIGLGFVLAVLYPPVLNETVRFAAALNSLLGIIAGGGSIYLIGVLGKILFRREAMGFGDVKYMAMMGAFLGWKLIILTFFIAPFFGAPIGIVLKIKEKADIMPYGPFLSLGAMVSLLWGEKILRAIFFYG